MLRERLQPVTITLTSTIDYVKKLKRGKFFREHQKTHCVYFVWFHLLRVRKRCLRIFIRCFMKQAVAVTMNCRESDDSKMSSSGFMGYYAGIPNSELYQ